MRRIILIIILSCQLSIVNWVAAQSLTPVYKEVNCGEMLYRKPATYVVDFKNNTATALEIKSVDTGCGCAKASYTKGQIMPGASAQVTLTMDAKQLGHFDRVLRVFTDNSDTPAEVLVSGVVVTKIENYSGEYPYKMGNLLADKDAIEFDDINKGQRLSQEIHVMNPTTRNATPVLLRLPAYITTEMKPATLGPKQKGIMKVTIHSNKLRDYGLAQTTVYLARNTSDKATPEKAITISSVLLPPAMAQNDVNRPYAPRLVMSRKYIDMTPLQKKSKYKDVITLKNEGRNALDIQKLQLFTTGVEVSLDKQKIQPGEEATLTVTCKAKELKKQRVRPRLLMITNDPNHQKVVLEIRK